MIPGVPLIHEVTSYQGIIDDIQHSNDFYIEQKLLWIEAVTQGCCEQANKYKVYNGVPPEGKMVFGVMEESDGCMRCCCAPGHTYDLHVVSNEGFEINSEFPTLLSREGCCGKWLCCWTCGESCQNNATVYPNVAGTKYDYEEKICNGCKPEIVMYVKDAPGTQDRIPIAIIAGPACFGGCSEACVDSHFTVTSIDPETMNAQGGVELGNIAKINKRHPEGCGELVQECCTDVDKFNINFAPSFIYNQDPNFKLAVMAALFYLDYMFFEMDNGMIDCRDQNLVITCCNLYCCGCICPCECVISGNQG